MFKFKIGKNHKTILKELEKYIEDLIDTNKDIRGQLKYFNRDTEIQKLTDGIYDIKRNSLHILNEKERQGAKSFAEDHYNSCNSILGVSYILTPTGMGTGVEIECRKCKERRDITDMNRW